LVAYHSPSSETAHSAGQALCAVRNECPGRPTMQKSETAFLAAYDAYADAIFRYCYVRLHDREQAKDVTQETFVRTWEWLAKGNKAENLRAFLYRIATNITVDLYRKRRDVPLEALPHGADIRDDARSADPLYAAQVRHVVSAIERLDPTYADALLMRYVEDMPVKEIARALGISENAASVRLHRGITRLKKELQ